MFIQAEEFVISFGMERIKLVCKRVDFYSNFDEDAFFEWLKKISCISKMEGFGEELYIDVDRSKLTEMDLREMLALFYRYNIDMKQLELFLSDENKSWFFDNKESFWYDRIWKERRENKNKSSKTLPLYFVKNQKKLS